MKTIIKSFHSPEIADLQNFKPKICDNFSFLLQLMIGPEHEMGEEAFDIEVCTPQWMLSNYKKSDVIFGRHMLIVLEYDFERIFKKIKEFVENSFGNDWAEVAQQIGKIAAWEFEDYDHLNN